MNDKPSLPGAGPIEPVQLQVALEERYLAYALSTIMHRALPDVRDGLKPVHRRIIYAMRELGLTPESGFLKCAKIVGDTMGDYHPHGDASIYDALARLAQDFAVRYPLIDGQGNFGNIDGDNPAAPRYTEARITDISAALLEGIDENAVDFRPNYDGREQEPVVLPAAFPNLLANGSAGIAVGMATNIPPHNLSEVVDATIALIDVPDIDVDALMEYIPGPDFPTAGIINGTAGIINAYRTGRGRVRMRARAEIEVNDTSGREAIAVTEIPYQVNKARLIEKIAELVKEKKLEGISELRDESDKDGMRIFIEVKRGFSAEVLLNNLYQQTQMESVFAINMVALVHGRPQLLNLKQILEAFIRHRREVVTRRTIFDLRKARARAHILEGLTVALANIDEMIALIKTSANPNEARERMLARTWAPGLVGALLAAAGADASRPDDLPDGVGFIDGRYQLTETQASQILEMRLHRLTGLEQEKLTDEYKLLLETIRGLIEILENPDVLLDVIRAELRNVKEEFGDARRSEIRASEEDLDILDLIAPEDVVVTLSHSGYAKRQPASSYRAQKRGGKGRNAASMKEEDFIDQLWLVNTHDTLLTFTSAGRVFWLPVYQLPDAGPNARGRPIINWIPLEEGEQVQAVLPVRDYDDRNVLFATRNGTVKKTALAEFAYRLARGKIAINLDDGDALIGVALTNGERDVMLFASNGKGVRFAENEIRTTGRNTTGVRGIRLTRGEEVRSLIVVDGDGDILTASERGFGKRTPVDEYPRKGRGTQGVIALKTTARNGKLVGAIQLSDHHEVLLISDGGTLVRTRASEISQVSRNTQGVTLMRLAADETLQAIERVDASLDDEIEAGVVGGAIDVGDVGDAGEVAAPAADKAPPSVG